MRVVLGEALAYFLLNMSKLPRIGKTAYFSASPVLTAEQFQMAELGVRNEAVENQRGADAGAQRGGVTRAILARFAAPNLLLGKTGGVSVVHR